MHRNVKIIIGVVVLVGAAVGGKFLYDNFHVSLPDYPPVGKHVWLKQNWEPKERDWYHHASQGTQTFNIPYEWFIALEQPTISLFSKPGKLSDPSYLDRYGFIPSSTEGGDYDWSKCPAAGQGWRPDATYQAPGGGRPEKGRHALPVGFACGDVMQYPDGTKWKKPGTDQLMTGVGLTCAACHTGRFTYKDTTVLVDGGPALTDLGKFRKGLGLSIAFTKLVPGRFDRFAERVLGDKATDPAKAELKKQLEMVLQIGQKILSLDKKVAPQSVEEGFGRLDALNRIGNQVFSLDLRNDENYAGYSAPVHFPRIWNTSWFDWVQYNASIEQPMVRNAGEALGVSATIFLKDPTDKPTDKSAEKQSGSAAGQPSPQDVLYASGINVEVLFQMEQQLAGKQADAKNGFSMAQPLGGTQSPGTDGLSGLKSPAWPAEILPPIDRQLALKGGELYKRHCQQCHLPAVTDEEFWKSKRWLAPNKYDQRYLQVELIHFDHIGTDSAHAEDMWKRRVETPPYLGIKSDEFGPALGELVEKVVKVWYEQKNIPSARRTEMDGYRDNGIQAPSRYKVRPLNGVWATPPYLHNGSVPTIYALLSPVAERPTKFFLGNREYDPVNLGYVTDRLSGGFEFDTSKRGNRNTGHEFNDAPEKPGVIGRKLSHDERMALIEFLKTQ